MSAADLEKQQELFESWAKITAPAHSTRMKGGEYVDYPTHCAWRGWQAALAAQEPESNFDSRFKALEDARDLVAKIYKNQAERIAAIDKSMVKRMATQMGWTPPGNCEPVAWRHDLPNGSEFSDRKKFQLLSSVEHANEELKIFGGSITPLYAAIDAARKEKP